jgi:integrase/recombinase XerD
MTSSFPTAFRRQYINHLKHLKLKWVQPKTIDAYARPLQRLKAYFGYHIEALTEQRPTCCSEEVASGDC